MNKVKLFFVKKKDASALIKYHVCLLVNYFGPVQCKESAFQDNATPTFENKKNKDLVQHVIGTNFIEYLYMEKKLDNVQVHHRSLQKLNRSQDYKTVKK